MPTLTELTFDLVRRESSRSLGVCQEVIRPEMPLEWYVPKERRPAFWGDLRRALKVRMPELYLSPALARTGWWVSWGAAARGLIVGLCLAAKWVALPLAVVSFVATAIGYFSLTRRWATEHPEIFTFGDLSRSILAHNLPAFRKRFGLKPNRDEIFATMRVILSDGLGVKQEEVTWEATLIGDLGAE